MLPQSYHIFDNLWLFFIGFWQIFDEISCFLPISDWFWPKFTKIGPFLAKKSKKWSKRLISLYLRSSYISTTANGEIVIQTGGVGCSLTDSSILCKLRINFIPKKCKIWSFFEVFWSFLNYFDLFWGFLIIFWRNFTNFRSFFSSFALLFKIIQ